MQYGGRAEEGFNTVFVCISAEFVEFTTNQVLYRMWKISKIEYFRNTSFLKIRDFEKALNLRRWKFNQV